MGFQVTVPATTPRNAALHVAGNMNGWNPGDPQWQLRRQADGTWSGQFPLEPGYALQFKLTRGSWETVEKDAKGGELPNRTVEVGPATTVRIQVASWRDQAPGAAVTHTVSGDLRLIEDFAMPQLATTRTLRILLPPGYETSGRRYPVLYMHDAQNLFDAATSFAGEWNVDETLTKLSASGALPAMIVVGIDHGGKERLAEYSPYRDERIPTAKGDAYADFLVQTLKPWVDRTYRTKPEATHTALAGSSLGGLISLHTALRHPGAFGQGRLLLQLFLGGRTTDAEGGRSRETGPRPAPLPRHRRPGGRGPRRQPPGGAGHAGRGHGVARAGPGRGAPAGGGGPGGPAHGERLGGAVPGGAPVAVPGCALSRRALRGIGRHSK
ncbi:MAG: alpha/beta hydrolase [Holophagaceae bacterium]|nr:alpha/beta hydrolase [Holophagaceae bacterium]